MIPGDSVIKKEKVEREKRKKKEMEGEKEKEPIAGLSDRSSS